MQGLQAKLDKENSTEMSRHWITNDDEMIWPDIVQHKTAHAEIFETNVHHDQ